MKPIHFTQFLRPSGRTRRVQIFRPNKIADAAEEFVGRGGRLECEVLGTGEVSLTAEIGDDDEAPVAIEVVPNGPAVPEAVDRLIDATRAALGRYAIRLGLDVWWDGTAWDESDEALSNAKRFPTVKAATLEIGDADLGALPDWICPVHDLGGCRCRPAVRIAEIVEGEPAGIPATPPPGPTGAEIAREFRAEDFDDESLRAWAEESEGGPGESLPSEEGESGPEPDGTLPDPPASG